MARTSDETRMGRKERVWLYVQRHASGSTEGEIAEFTGFERRSVNNYLRDLETEGKLFKDGTLWYALDYEQTRLRSFDLQPEEAMALYLAARLLVKQQDKRNEPAETALLKLAQVLTADAGVGQAIEEAARELVSRPVLDGYQPIFQTAVRGYLYRRKLALRYRPLNGRPFETLFSIYLIEPSPVGYATYLIGYSEVSGGLRSYKLERVEEARLTGERYQIPADFKGLETLRSAWSIIYGEQTLRVELRFSPQVRARVLETTWHPSQRVAEDAQRPGWLRWEAEVADTLDMLPWIRGWGADCEVLAPEGLREGMEQEAKKLVRVYGIGDAKPGDGLIAHVRKQDRKEQSLITHLTEASQLAERFAAKVGLSEIGKIMGLLHDFGKASVKYQNYLRTNEGLISPDEDGFDPESKRGDIDHSTAGRNWYTRNLPPGAGG